MTDEMDILCADVINDATNGITKTIHDAGGEPEDAIFALVSTITLVISQLCDDKDGMHSLFEDNIVPCVQECIDGMTECTLN